MNEISMHSGMWCACHFLGFEGSESVPHLLFVFSVSGHVGVETAPFLFTMLFCTKGLVRGLACFSFYKSIVKTKKTKSRKRNVILLLFFISFQIGSKLCDRPSNSFKEIIESNLLSVIFHSIINFTNHTNFLSIFRHLVNAKLILK